MSSASAVEVSSQAYAKLYLHAIEHPHAPVSGLLLAAAPDSASASRASAQAGASDGDGAPTLLAPSQQRGDGSGSGRLVFVDAIPLFHTCASITLAPALEIALNLVYSLLFLLFANKLLIFFCFTRVWHVWVFSKCPILYAQCSFILIFFNFL